MRRTRDPGLPLACLGALVLGACSGNPPDANAETGGGQAAVLEAAPVDAAAAPASLHPAMAYGDARSQLLAAGWIPRPNPQCRADVAGGDADAVCTGTSPLALCRVCEELPELQACSADARCLVRFGHPGRPNDLELRLYGEIEHWAQTGEDAPLQVSAWDSVPSE